MVFTKYASKDQRKDLGIDINFEVNQDIYLSSTTQTCDAWTNAELPTMITGP